MKAKEDSLPISDVPIVDCFVYTHLPKGKIIRIEELYRILSHTILCSKGDGGNRKGIPRCLAPFKIKEMKKYKLIQKLDTKKYDILYNYHCEKKLKNFPFW